ncbi:MAG: metallophosphoesterase, partial [Armatimonadetes bacterium]|nr:metallophosphoesterase [Armatimonadota bacterium]
MKRRAFLAASAASLTATCTASIGFGAASNNKKKRCTLLHVTDTHAQLETHLEYLPGDTSGFRRMGGFARLKTAIDANRANSHGPAFLVDGGDLVQGSGPASWSRGEIMIEPANQLGLDAFVPGNWEPVYGPAQFLHLMGQLKTRVMAYNFHSRESGERLFTPAVTVRRDGVKVSFIGIADPTTTERQSPKQVEGLDSTQMVGLRDFVKRLRQTEAPDLVVAVTHTGLTVSRQLAREIPELDVILSGHTHERTQQVILEGNAIIVEAGSLGSFLGRLDLTIKPGGG